MNTPLDKLLGPRLWPLFLKELRQIKRNRRLVVSLIIPPTVQLLLFGFALNPEVKNLRLGVVDESRTPESRELVSAFVESLSFEVTSYYESPDALGRSLSAGRLDAGLIVPEDYAKRRARRETADVQLLIDAVNSNTAAIAGGYAARIVAALNQKLASPQRSAPPSLARANITPRIALLYNPGLQNAWFIVTGTLGTLLVLNGSLVAAASMVKEKEAGTVEQLLMTPAEASEIITAKIAPLFLLLTADIALALIVGYVVFGVPVRGSFVLLYTAGALCVLAGIGIGTFLATFTKSQQQAQLMGFFVNPPIALLSGVTTPVEAMPHWLQPFTNLNPVRHFALIARGIMLKGSGLDVLYPNMLALLGFAVVLVGVSAWRFRRQLS
jgi:ABC-2 type transport system permease protein